MTPEQLKQLLQRYAETWALVDSQERTYGHAGTDNLARKSTLESQILSLFVEAEEGARRERTEWMDIETAPKDGTNFLACSPVSSVFLAHYANGIVDSSDWTDDYGYLHRHATHWMKLPEPPDVETERKTDERADNLI